MTQTIKVHAGDYVVWGVDLTGSMAMRDADGGKQTRLDYVRGRIVEAYKALAGSGLSGRMDVIGFGSMIQAPGGELNADNAQQLVGALIATDANTRTHELVSEARNRASASQAGRTVLLICTDGAPDDVEALQAELRRATGEGDRKFDVYLLRVGQNLGEFPELPGVRTDELQNTQLEYEQQSDAPAKQQPKDAPKPQYAWAEDAKQPVTEGLQASPPAHRSHEETMPEPEPQPHSAADERVGDAVHSKHKKGR